MFHLFHTSKEMFKMLSVIGDGVWLAHVYCVLCVFFLCHLYYMDQENCGLLVIYAFKILTPCFLCFCEDGCDGTCMDGSRWFHQIRQKIK